MTKTYQSESTTDIEILNTYYDEVGMVSFLALFTLDRLLL